MTAAARVGPVGGDVWRGLGEIPAGWGPSVVARVVGLLRDTAALSTPARRARLAQDLGVDAVLIRSGPEG